MNKITQQIDKIERVFMIWMTIVLNIVDLFHYQFSYGIIN